MEKRSLGEAVYKIIPKTLKTLMDYSFSRLNLLIDILVKKTRVLRPGEYKKLLDGCQKQDLRTILQTLLYTGMRYIELKRFQSYPSWFDGVQFIHLPHMADRKIMRTQQERQVRLNPMGKIIVDYFLQVKRPLPAYQTWQENMQTWARRGGISEGGLCAKTTRKTWESWLMFYYPQRAMEIALSQGHTTLTSLQHYCGMAFTDIERIEMSQFVEGW